MGDEGLTSGDKLPVTFSATHQRVYATCTSANIYTNDFSTLVLI
jgi:hypothetical protein